MFRKMTTAVVLMAVLMGTAGAAPKRPADPEISKMVAAYYKAWNTFDFKKLDPFYAPDADAIFFDVTPFEYHGWSAYKAGVQKLFLDNMKVGRLIPHDDLRVWRRGNIAWNTLGFRFIYENNAGQKFDLECRHTQVWEKRNGRWVVVHEHLSEPKK